MTFAKLLDSFQGKRALVLGDLMLDEYVFGRASRISPEAPVIVIRQERTQRLPGGAANVARNLRALGAEVTVAGVAGADEESTILESVLSDAGLARVHLEKDAGRQTTRKTRVVADHAHQVLRIDSESEAPVSPDVEERLIGFVQGTVSGADLVLLSDYLKGAMTERVVRAAIEGAVATGVPVVANPKPRSLGFYRGCSLVSLNRAEASEAIGAFSPVSNEAAERTAAALRESCGVESVLLTLGEAGLVAVGDQVIRVDAPKVEVYDTAGAGDTVAATVALGLASCGFHRSVFELAAETAACVVRHVGVATPSASDLAQIRAK
jgi:D-beta-D-heptose 7-phosphate kinase/D-beta-D-heptose 1-phosphate adenosyltransferase